MILCVDIGNTSIKMARVEGSRIYDRMSRASDESAERIARLLRRVARDGFDAAAIASVRPQATTAVRAMIRRDLGVEPFIVTSRARLPLEIATRRPARVGVDRICAACGALAGGGRSAIVVDAGSAITVDLVLDHRFVGGLILPGPQMMLSAMHHFTAQLPDLALTEDRILAFDDTAPAMRSGVVVGSAGAIEGAVEHLRRKAGGHRIPVYVTGGHATRLKSRLPSGWKFKPDLTLIGLAAIARANPRGA
jgi:type III pantothenate kinase